MSRIEIDGKVVVLIVEERSIIANVSFVGLKEFDNDTLLKALKDSGIGEAFRSTAPWWTVPNRRSSAST